MQQNLDQGLPILYILSTVVALLQTIVVGLMGWLIKTTTTSKDQLNTVNTTLFGPNDKGGGLVDDVRTMEGTLESVRKDILDIKHYLNVPSRRSSDQTYDERKIGG